TTGEGMEVTWSDSHVSRYTFPYLRDNCPCAMCNDEREKKAKAGNSPAVLPMFKPRVTAKAAKPVGNYAVQIEYSDGHSTGIYSFTHLREICPCEECQREFGAAVKSAG
ncbi:MAG: gamma-butyrobetaine hydroxylase-like domain-containing protein, partial [Terracidiphilus sp.]